jgi:hypothetical protein
MEPAERIESAGTALGKRPRSRVLPRTASMVTVPSAAKQGRQERGAGVPSSCSLPAACAGMVAVPGGYYYCGTSFAAVETAAFLKACGLCKRHLGPGHDTFIYRFQSAWFFFVFFFCLGSHLFPSYSWPLFYFTL